MIKKPLKLLYICSSADSKLGEQDQVLSSSFRLTQTTLTRKRIDLRKCALVLLEVLGSDVRSRMKGSKAD